MKVIIAEKPDVAKHWAKIVGAKKFNDGYIEGNGFQVTWAYGHLVQLAPPKDYGWIEWKKENLPMIPAEFILQVSDGKEKQFNVVKNLFSSCDEIYVATDADREGELIFRYIYLLSGVTKPFKRLWFSDLTEASLKKSLANIKPGSDYDNLFHSAMCRSRADWLIGLNATQALTLNSGSASVLSLGRVQTPVLVIICRRWIENKNFKSVPYFEVFIICQKNGVSFSAKLNNRFNSEAEAKTVVSSLTDSVIVKSFEQKERSENAPRLFNLSSLQQEANTKLGLSADQTLVAAQQLYEAQYTSYPRSDSEYLAESHLTDLPSIFANVFSQKEYAPFESLLSNPSKSPINDKEVTAHHAIIPTQIVPEKALSKEAMAVYDLIVKRFLAAFAPVCLKDVTSIVLTASNHEFLASGFVIKSIGWRTIYTKDKVAADEETDADETEASQILPVVAVAESLPLLDKKLSKKTTKAKPLFTDSSLLKVMETGGKEVDSEDPEILKTLREKGLGTPATRAAIIKLLIDREFVSRDKRKLIPTEKGLFIFNFVKDLLISKPEMTGTWEMALNKIAEGKLPYDVFLSKIKTYASDLTSEILASQIRIEQEICPKCNQKTFAILPALGLCSNSSCELKVFKNVFDKKVPDDLFKILLSGQQSSLVKGFTYNFKEVDGTETKKSFDGFIYLNDEFKLKVKSASEVLSDSFSNVLCPKCKSKGLKAMGKRLGCQKEGCGFVLWKEVNGKELSEKNLQHLIDGKTTELIKGFLKKKKEGEEDKKADKFEAKLKLNAEFKTEFVFENKKK